MADTHSRLARDLKPYIVGWIREAIAAASGLPAGGGTGAPASVAAHALNNTSIHTGSLAPAQFPDALLRDGSRALVGNLAVGSGITIDGMDPSVHILDPDAHHKRVTSANSEIAVNANQVLTLGSHDILARHSISGGAALDVIGLSAAGTLARLTPRSDVGTAPAAALLKSTAAGGLILANLGVKGDVDITDGGDLYVAGSIGGASGVMVTMGDRVGFGRIPDPQFMVDVNGPLRADYLIGKHAIQLEGVLFLAHYDGHEPYATNFTGELNGHMGQVAQPTGSVLCRPGKFYKGVQIAPGGTNYIKNPSFEVNVTDAWQLVSTGSVATRTQDTTRAYVGSASCRLNNQGAASAFIASDTQGTTLALPNGVEATASAYLWIDSGSARIAIYEGGTLLADATVSATEDWQLATVTYGNTSGASKNIHVRISFNNALGDLWVDAVQLSVGRGTPYLDGSMGGFDVNGKPSSSAHAWSGTPHNSASTRGAATLRYGAAGNIRIDRGTVMAWVKIRGRIPAANQWVFAHPVVASTSRLYLFADTSFQWAATIGGTTLTGPTAAVNTWTHLAVTWANGTAKLYINGGVNGAPNASGPYSGMTTLADRFHVGTDLGDSAHLNGWIDDLVIVDRALTAQEVVSVYESDAPVFAESSVFVFRATPTGLVWADENGLWMRDADGNPVLGAYGGKDATNSWGGKSLAKGDILFGRYGASDGGWLYFDRDGVSSLPFLSLGYADKTLLALDSGGATLDGVLDVSATGGIYQGTGTFASPTTGLKVWNDSGVGRIAGYASGTAQWYANTDGKLYAGAGAVRMDSSGIAGYSGANLQWSAGTDGKLTAGGGTVTLDSAGLYVQGYQGSFSTQPTERKITVGKNHLGQVIGEIASYYFTTPVPAQTFHLSAPYSSTYATRLLLGAYGSGGTLANYIELDSSDVATGGDLDVKGNEITVGPDYLSTLYIARAQADNQYFTSSDAGDLTVRADDGGLWIGTFGAYNLTLATGNAGRMAIAADGTISIASRIAGPLQIGDAGGTQDGVLYVNQGNSTAAIPPLQLVQADTSEEFIRFGSAVGAGSPVDTAALGTYYGKLRVSVNGTFRYIPLYNS